MKQEKTKKSYASLVIWGIFALVCIGIIALIVRAPQEEVAASTSESVLAVTANDWIKGPKEAPVTLIEYGDFECPACAQYFPFLNQLAADFPDDLRIVYRNFPLVQIHANAFDAARAVEAAGRQGRFWTMHDRLYSMQTDWAPLRNAKDRFIAYAEQIGLDKEQFALDINEDQITKKVNDDLASANKLQLNSTPTFFLQGAKIQPRGYQEFKTLVANEISKIKDAEKAVSSQEAAEPVSSEDSLDFAPVDAPQ